MVRQFLISHPDRSQQVQMMYFYAVPTDGAAVANVIRYFWNSPQVDGMIASEFNNYLDGMYHNWMGRDQLKDLPTYCAFETQDMLIGRIVPESSARALCTKSIDPLPGDHIQIVKPRYPGDQRFTVLETAIKSSLQAASVSPPKPPHPPAPKPSEEKPDVSVVLVYSKEPALILNNTSNVVAREIKYWFAIWNLNRIANNMPSPLQIPSATADWIRPKDRVGPMNIFNRVLSQLQSGDRLTGYIGVTCPNCLKTRLFWVDINYDQGGWYAEMTPREVESMKTAINIPKQLPDGIPVNRRIAINDTQ